MARVAIGTVSLANTGAVVNPTAGDATDHHVFTWSKNRILIVHNGSGSSINVTIDTPETGQDEDGNAVTIAQRVVAVAAGAVTAIDTRSRTYRQEDGTVYVNLSSATTVKVGVLDVIAASE